MKTSSPTDIYQMVTNLIIEKLENGIVPWRKPWNDYGPAVNYLSKKPNRGINHLILSGLHCRPFYLTFHQAKSLGGRIKKGAKSIPVVYWNFTYRHKETKRTISTEDISKYPADKIVKNAFLKYYRIFKIDDVIDITYDLPEVQLNT